MWISRGGVTVAGAVILDSWLNPEAHAGAMVYAFLVMFAFVTGYARRALGEDEPGR